MSGGGGCRARPAASAGVSLVAALLFAALSGCGPSSLPPAIIEPAEPLPPPKLWRWELVRVYPHDPAAFTQGLLWHDGALYESLGLYGQSAVRRVELATGKTLAETRLPPRFFGEGLALAGGDLIQLTWREGVAFVWDIRSLKMKRSLTYPGEGWGLALFGKELILSDGTDTLRVLDPGSFRERRRIRVRSDKGPVTMLNELEMMGGLLLANLFQKDEVAIIDPATGAQTGRLDFSGLFPDSERTPQMDVLNGLAWREETKTLFVTGKRWPLLFEVRPVEP